MMGHVKTVAIFAASWFVLHENFSHIKWLGCFVTISGIYLFNKYPKCPNEQRVAKEENVLSGHNEEIRKSLTIK